MRSSPGSCAPGMKISKKVDDLRARHPKRTQQDDQVQVVGSAVTVEIRSLAGGQAGLPEAKRQTYKKKKPGRLRSPLDATSLISGVPSSTPHPRDGAAGELERVVTEYS